MACKSDLSKCNKKLNDPVEGKPMIILQFGYYVSWGLHNHNPVRLEPLVKRLVSAGFGVQLQHVDGSADFVKLIQEKDKLVLATEDRFQNSAMFHQREELSSNLLAKMQAKLRLL